MDNTSDEDQLRDIEELIKRELRSPYLTEERLFHLYRERDALRRMINGEDD